MGMLTSLEKVKTYLGSKSQEDDAVLNALIGAASPWVVRYLSNDPEYKPHTEIHSGSGTTFQMLKNSPVVSVSAVVIDGVAASSYVFDDVSVELTGGGVFTKGARNVSITYTSGYNPVPDDLQHAVAEVVALMYKERSRLGETSRAIGPGATASFDLSAMSKRCKAILSNYRRVWPML